jgi:hypothetical protein
MVTEAVFCLKGEVRVTRAEYISESVVVGGVLVFVRDENGDRRARGAPFEDAGKYLRRIRFPSGSARLRIDSGSAAVQVALDDPLVEQDSRRAPVDDYAHSGPVALPESSHAKSRAKGVSTHLPAPSKNLFSR